MDEARQELHRIINDREMKDSLLLVFANKQDLKEGASGNLLEQVAAANVYPS
jgi:ADP-ribosylation factor protein 6